MLRASSCMQATDDGAAAAGGCRGERDQQHRSPSCCCLRWQAATTSDQRVSTALASPVRLTAAICTHPSVLHGGVLLRLAGWNRGRNAGTNLELPSNSHGPLLRGTPREGGLHQKTVVAVSSINIKVGWAVA
jgi:hypothetical protein